MVNAVASRVIPRQRVSKAMAQAATAEASRMNELVQRADAPISVARIPSRAGDNFKMANVVVRPMGNSRRIFLMDPHLLAEDLEGLAHRIHALSNNEAINSVLIASDDQDDGAMNCLPRYVTELENPNFGGLNLDFDPSPGSTWHVSGGYDPLTIQDDQEHNKYLLESLRKLALATKGEDSGVNSTRVPVITMPHGIVTDGGYALCMGGYVLATRQTSFRIMNPSRGLSFDPVGFSFILPRLGWENKQRSAKYRGCGLLLALAGFEANCFDMVETNLATHLVSDSSALPLLEENLAVIPPWNQQRLVTNPPRLYGKKHDYDPNNRFRNKTIAHVIEQLSEHSSNQSNSLPYDFSVTNAGDPALDIDHVPWDSGFFSSHLVDTAAHFDMIFKNEKSVEGIMERLREAGDKKSDDREEQENSRIAKELVVRMQSQSPLALEVIFQLMRMGSFAKATMEKCMEQEINAQLNMYQQSDFKEWAAHVRKHGGETKAPAFGGWKHKSVKDVTSDEVDAIIGDQS
jgi:enoyl-CoA hydratase/carnithine racemase